MSLLHCADPIQEIDLGACSFSAYTDPRRSGQTGAAEATRAGTMVSVYFTVQMKLQTVLAQCLVLLLLQKPRNVSINLCAQITTGMGDRQKRISRRWLNLLE